MVASENSVEHDCYSPLMLVSYGTAREKCPFCNDLITQSTKGSETILPEADGPLVLDSVTAISDVSSERGGGSSFRFRVLESFSRPEHISSHLGFIVGVVGVLITLMIFLVPSVSTFAFRRLRKVRNHAPLVEPIECARSLVEGDQLTLKAHAQDADNERLKFVWSILPETGRIEITNDEGSQAIFHSEGVPPGIVVIGLTVSDEFESVAQKQEIYVSARQNHPPELIEPPSCNCTNTEVRAGETIPLEAFAEDRDKGDTLTYEWWSSIPSVKISDSKSARGSRVIIDTSGLNPQSSAIPLKIYLKVTDHHSSPLLSDITIMVLPKQFPAKFGESPPRVQQTNHPPRFEKFSISKSLVDEGESVELRALVIDPDGDTPLYYNWTTSAGAIQYNHDTATLNTSGVSGSEVEVTVTVSDGNGPPTSLRTTIMVKPRANKSPLSSPSPSTTREGMPTPKT
jgi:hypothetical protein